MEPTSFFGEEIISTLRKVRALEEVVQYEKIDGDEFVKVPEKGFYLHSKNGDGIIFDCRIYLVSMDGYYPAGDFVRGRFASAISISDVENMIGPSVREIRPIRIPTRPETLPGKVFNDGDYVLKFFLDDQDEIKYFHISRGDLI